MNRKTIWISAGLLVVLLGGAYGAYDYFAGNHVEIQSVIPAQAAAGGASGEVIAADKLNRAWMIQQGSQAYFSVTTSKETVNFAGKSVKGSWNLNLNDPAKNTANGTVEIAALDSGNAQRDNHVKGADYLNAGQFPESTFTVKSFEKLPKEWKEGTSVPFLMAGTLTVKGISKDVTFESEAVYDKGTIKMEGDTVITFADFGMKNPHTVMLDTQNNVTVKLSLILAP